MDEAAGKAMADEVKSILAVLAGTVVELKEKLDKYPDLTEEMLKDGIAYALINGKYEGVASSGRNVVTYNPVTAATLEALDTFKIPVGKSQEILEGVKANLPEEIWNDLEDEPSGLPLDENVSSDEMQIQKAIESYWIRKAQMVAEREAEKAAMEDRGSLDVEPKNREKI